MTRFLKKTKPIIRGNRMWPKIRRGSILLGILAQKMVFFQKKIKAKPKASQKNAKKYMFCIGPNTCDIG